MSAAADTDGSGFKSQGAHQIKETQCPPVWRNGARLSPSVWPVDWQCARQAWCKTSESTKTATCVALVVAVRTSMADEPLVITSSGL